MIETLKARADFLKARSGTRLRGRFFVVNIRTRTAEEPVLPDTIRVGYTVTKRQGNAVERNRIKRRLRALVRETATEFRSGCDYVITGHREMLNTPFATLKAELENRLSRNGKPGRGSQTASRVPLPPGPQE